MLMVLTHITLTKLNLVFHLFLIVIILARLALEAPALLEVNVFHVKLM
jgi:hypothetical protein